MIVVSWTDHSRYEIYRRYSEFFSFQVRKNSSFNNCPGSYTICKHLLRNIIIVVTIGIVIFVDVSVNAVLHSVCHSRACINCVQ